MEKDVFSEFGKEINEGENSKENFDAPEIDDEDYDFEEKLEKSKEKRESEEAKTEEVRKSGGTFFRGLKRLFFIFILLIIFVILSAVVLALLLKFGVDDLIDDDGYLLVVQSQGVARSGIWYQRSTNADEIVNVEDFPSLDSISSFFSYANGERKIERQFVIDAEVIRKYSDEDSFEFEGAEVQIEDFVNYLKGTLAIPPEFGADDIADWEILSNMLGAWAVTFHETLFGNLRENYRNLVNDYRKNDIVIYPGNSALFVVEFIPIERLI